MSIEKVRINKVEIKDEVGKFGPQKKVVFTQYLDEGERRISGWVNAKYFNPSEWAEGKEMELDITQNGNFWNFKVVTKALKEKNELSDQIMAKLTSIEAKLDKILAV